jgi:hypothetical protein
MRSINQPFVTLLMSVVLCFSGCQHKPETVETGNFALPWSGFGTPGPGKIRVSIDGDVSHPGLYFLESGANLESAYFSFGGWGGRGGLGADDGLPPFIARIRRPSGGPIQQYRIQKMSKEEREAVKLEDGDLLEYPTVIF